MSRVPVRKIHVVKRRSYTFSESVSAYWFLRQLRNRLNSENGCINCRRYLGQRIHSMGMILGLTWIELQVVNELKKKEVA